MQNQKQSKPPKKPKSNLNKFARFSGAGLQMGATIYLFNLAGSFLDDKYQKTYFETVLTLFAIFVSMYVLIKQVQKISE